MKIYKKSFIVDINDKSNTLFAFVGDKMSPKGEKSWYELNGIRYNVVSFTDWSLDKNEVARAKQYESSLKSELLNMGTLQMFSEGYVIKEKLEEIACWQYQTIFVEKEEK